MPSSNDSPKTPKVKIQRKWVVVQLSHAGEREKNISALEKSVKRIVGQLEVFVPAASQSTKDGVRDDSNTMFYMDGYVFVEYRSGVNYGKLSDTTYFSSVLAVGREYHLLNDSDINPLKKGVQKMKIGSFSEGDEVKVVKGTFKDLPGKVTIVYDGNEVVQVETGFLSKRMLIDFPSSYLKKSESR